MTKEEEFAKAWRLGSKGDFSLVDKIYHPKYRAIQKNINVEVDSFFKFTFAAIDPH